MAPPLEAWAQEVPFAKFHALLIWRSFSLEGQMLYFSLQMCIEDDKLAECASDSLFISALGRLRNVEHSGLEDAEATVWQRRCWSRVSLAPRSGNHGDTPLRVSAN